MWNPVLLQMTQLAQRPQRFAVVLILNTFDSEYYHNANESKTNSLKEQCSVSYVVCIPHFNSRSLWVITNMALYSLNLEN